MHPTRMTIRIMLELKTQTKKRPLTYLSKTTYNLLSIYVQRTSVNIDFPEDEISPGFSFRERICEKDERYGVYCLSGSKHKS